jgi:ERCC4-related helicase
MVEDYVSNPLVRDGVVERREYQDKIAKTGLRENTLIILPTGLGKTVIAAMVTVERLRTFPKGKILVLAPTKPLVHQHYERFKEFLNLKEDKLIVLTGLTFPEKRRENWLSGKIFFATPQILENDIIAGRINLQDFVLIIFDEGHRAVGNYPYVYIADQYMKNAENPRIIGLTASPGYTKEGIEKIRTNLFISTVEARTDSSKDVSPHVKPIKTEWRRVALPTHFLEVKASLEEIIDEKLKAIREKGYLGSKRRFRPNLRELLNIKNQIQSESAQQPYAQSDTIQMMKNVMTTIRLLSGLELLESQGFVSAKSFFDKLAEKANRSGSSNYLKILFFDERIKRAIQIIENKVSEGFDHPKIGILLGIVRFELTENKARRIIVFTNYRDTAKRLTDNINKIENGVATWFIGQSSRPQDAGLSQKNQLSVLSAFKEGIYKVLVATQVAEEGLDISECDLVIFYDNVPSAIRFIQRRGRTGRKEIGRVLILMAEKTKDEAFYWIARSRERKMQEILLNMQDDAKKIDGSSRLDSFLTDKEEIKKEDTEKRIVIHVDNRERTSMIARELLGMNVSVELSNLPVADYILSDRIAVERKNVKDLISSIIDKRLFDQLKALKETYSIPILLIEGEDIYAIGGMHPEAIRGAIASVIISYGIPIIWTKNQAESARMLYTMARREQSEREVRISIRGEKKPLSIKEMQEFIVAGLPSVDTVLATRLLNTFKNVEGIFTVSKKQLMEVKGIGEKIADKIRLIASYDYYEQDNPVNSS